MVFIHVIVHTVKPNHPLRGEGWLTVQPKASIPPPVGDGHMMKELLGAGCGALGTDSPTNGLPKSADDGDGVISQATQHLSHNGDEIQPRRSES